MAQEEFNSDIKAASERLESLRLSADLPARGLLPQVFEELRTSLEELRVAEEELRQQNEHLLEARILVEEERRRYQSLFEFAPDAYLVTDQDGNILEANHAASQLLNISIKFLAGKPLVTFVAASHLREFRRNLLRLSGKDSEANSFAVMNAPGVQEWDLRLAPRRGPAFDAVLTVGITASRLDQLDQPVTLRWLVRDVTERKQAEDARVQLVHEQAARAHAEAERQRTAEQAALLELMLGEAPVGFAFLDTECRYVRINGTLAAINGHTIEAHLGRTAADMLSPTYWQAAEPLLRRALGGEIVLNAEIANERPSHLGGIGHYLVSYYPVQSQGRTFGVGVIVLDISERKQQEVEMAAMYQREHRIAQVLQRTLLQTQPADAFPGLQVETLYEAASQEALVGGDFFDAFLFDDSMVALVVGDVSGKGLLAAAHTAELRYALRAYLRETLNPATALARLNNFVCKAQQQEDWGDANLIVLALATFDSKTGKGAYVSAGAESGVVIRADGGTSELRAHGMLLGVQRDVSYQEAPLRLMSGDTLLLATDGITEARRGHSFLGFEGLMELAQREQEHESLCEWGQAILEGARAYAGGALQDDACLLLARRV